MGIFDGRRPTIKVDPPRPRLRINNETGVDPADIAKRVAEARDRISAGRAIDPLLPPPIPKINLSFGRSVMPKLQDSGLQDLPNQLQSLVSKTDFGKYKFTFSQQDAHLNPQVVSGADVIRNTPIYFADNDAIRKVGFPENLEVAAAHHFTVGTSIKQKIDELGRVENLPTLSINNRSTQIEGMIHINPIRHVSNLNQLNDTVFHELGHAVSAQAGRTSLTYDSMYSKLGLIGDHFSAGTVPGSTIAVGQPVHINTVADYLGETLGTTLRQHAIEEARADTTSMVARAIGGDQRYLLKPITEKTTDADMWQTLWQKGEITPTSAYHYKGSLLNNYAQPFSDYVPFVDRDLLPIPKPLGGSTRMHVMHDNVLSIFERNPQWHTMGDKEKSKLMARVSTVAEARARAAYLAHLAAPEGMEESAAASLITGLQTNIRNFDSHGINFLKMFREEAENAGGLNATMLTAESADQTIVAKSFGSWMKRAIKNAIGVEREMAPIGSISSIKAIKGVTKAAMDGGSYAITESLRAVGKAGEAAPRSAVMTATTLERMLESAATALKVVRKV